MTLIIAIGTLKIIRNHLNISLKFIIFEKWHNLGKLMNPITAVITWTTMPGMKEAT